MPFVIPGGFAIDIGAVGRWASEPKEARPGPVGPGNEACDCSERGICLACVNVALFQHGDDVRSAMPLAHQALAWPQRELRLEADWLIRLHLLSKPDKAAAGRFAQASIGLLLDPIGYRSNQKVATKAWWILLVQPLPLGAKLLRLQLTQSFQPLRHVGTASTGGRRHVVSSNCARTALVKVVVHWDLRFRAKLALPPTEARLLARLL